MGAAARAGLLLCFAALAWVLLLRAGLAGVLPGTRHLQRQQWPCCSVGPSRLHGLGLFAARDLPANASLGLVVAAVPRSAASLLPAPLAPYALPAVITGPGLRLNHCPLRHANARVVPGRHGGSLVTRTAVPAGQELSADYDVDGPWFVAGAPPDATPCQ